MSSQPSCFFHDFKLVFFLYVMYVMLVSIQQQQLFVFVRPPSAAVV